MDEELLSAARRAQEQLIEADQAAEIAKARFHRAVRRLHLSGASLRELAVALQLSHQRVHQIVEAAGGGRRWQGRGRPREDPACSFCGHPKRPGRKLVAGPGTSICLECVETAEAVVRSGKAAETTLGPLHPVPADQARGRCSFCGKRRHQVPGLVTTVDNPAGGKFTGDAAICTACLTLCREIHADHLQ